MKKTLSVLLSLLLLLGILPFNAAATGSDSPTKDEVKNIPGGIYTYVDDDGKIHSQKISNTFSFVENNIAYKIVGEKQVEVADWSWRWNCGSDGHTGFVSTEYSNRSTLTIPATVSHDNAVYNVVGIGTGAFIYVTGTNVVLPDSITYLGVEAFAGYGDNGTLTIPASVTDIASSCFYGCNLTSISFEENSQLKSIGDKAFEKCYGLTKLVLPEGVETLGERLFISDEGGGNPFKVTIPGSVKNLSGATLEGYRGSLEDITFTPGDANFIKQNGIIYGYNKLLKVWDTSVETVTVPEGITEIGERAFAGCNSLVSVDLPESLVTLGAEAFRDRSSLTTITGGENITTIGEMTFMNCTSLKSIDLPKVDAIPTRAFDNCTALESANIPSIQELGLEAFDGCAALKSIVIPEGVTEIPKMAFCGCVSLESVILPEGLTNIGDYAFDLTVEDENGDYVNPNPKLESINIPSTVTSLGENFLGGVKANGETKLISQVADPSIFKESALAGISGESKPTLVYPEEYKDAYEGENSPVGDLIPSDGSGSELKYSLSIPATASVYTGNTTTLAVTSTIPTGATLEVTSSNGAATASLSGDNRTITVTGVSDGTATITVAMKLNGTTLTSKSCTVTVTTYNPPSGGGGGSSDPTYSISLPGKVTGGEVSIQKRYAEKGETVTITVTPDDGYELDELIVTDSKGNKLDLTDKGNGKFTFKMPAGRVEIEVSFQEIVIEPDNPFTDVSTSDYYYDAVLWAVKNGVTNGTSATTFGPNMAVSRAQMVTFLWRAHGSPKATGTNPFTDVSTSDYYYDAVLWAVANGVTNGTSATTFSPDMAVTRAQAVTFQWRAAGSPVVSGSSFGDVATDAYYVNAVTWAVANGITNGTGGNTFSPDVVVSRAQAVTFLYREQE